jgi:hypothetical protein
MAFVASIIIAAAVLCLVVALALAVAQGGPPGEVWQGPGGPDQGRLSWVVL